MLGPMREKITVQSSSEAVSSAGVVTKTWTTIATPFARVEPLDGTEAVKGERLRSDNRFRATVHFRGDWGAGLRVVWRGRTFDVTSCEDKVGDRKFLTLMMTEFGR